jgi:hypothetical protein
MDPGNDKRSAGQREHSHAIDHRTHGEQNAAIGAYIRWHNTRAEPKTNFAPDSPIRTWTDYPAKAA